MRLPDQSDRELVGKAANLNDDQITELAKLPCGVAAVYQNEWVQPVLCKVDRYDGLYNSYSYIPQNDDYGETELKGVEESLLRCIMDKELLGKGNHREICRLESMVIKSRLDTSV